MVYDIKRYHTIFPIGAPTSLPLLLPKSEENQQLSNQNAKKASPYRQKNKTASGSEEEGIHARIDLSKTIFKRNEEKKEEETLEKENLEKNEEKPKETSEEEEKKIEKIDENQDLIKNENDGTEKNANEGEVKENMEIKSEENEAKNDLKPDPIVDPKENIEVETKKEEKDPEIKIIGSQEEGFDDKEQRSQINQNQNFNLSIDPNYVEKISRLKDDIECESSTIKDIYDKSPGLKTETNNSLSGSNENLKGLEKKIRSQENLRNLETKTISEGQNLNLNEEINLHPEIMVKNFNFARQTTFTEETISVRQSEVNRETEEPSKNWKEEEEENMEEMKKEEEKKNKIDYEIDYSFNICNKIFISKINEIYRR